MVASTRSPIGNVVFTLQGLRSGPADPTLLRGSWNLCSDGYLLPPSVRLGEVAPQPHRIDLAFPSRHNERGYTVAQHVHCRAEHAHEAINSKNQSHSSYRNGRDHH